MTSRERVLAALEHREPDAVPIDFGGHRSSGIMAIAYARLKDYLGIAGGDIYVYDLVQQLAIVEPEVLDLFGVDVVEMGRGFALEDACWTDWELPDGTPCKVPAYIPLGREGNDWCIYNEAGRPIAVQKASSLYFEQT
ncbi:MAG: methyltransferase, partial [Candidatus Brocadiae bacterium]|nr:methyltransferase [Candidatus Brocadiia bacterium]